MSGRSPTALVSVAGAKHISPLTTAAVSVDMPTLTTEPLSRLVIMAELVLDLRNNRRRAEAALLVERGSQLRKWLSRLASRTSDVGAERRLRIAWADIMSVPSKGRWWLVGASWAGRVVMEQQQVAAHANADVKAEGTHSSAADASLLSLASEMRMNTPARRQVCTFLCLNVLRCLWRKEEGRRSTGVV